TLRLMVRVAAGEALARALDAHRLLSVLTERVRATGLAVAERVCRRALRWRRAHVGRRRHGRNAQVGRSAAAVLLRRSATAAKPERAREEDRRCSHPASVLHLGAGGGRDLPLVLGE